VIVDVVPLLPFFVLTVNVADVAPDGILTVPGTVAAVLLDESVIVSPLLGAGPLIFTVPADDAPPRTDDGFRTMLTTVGGVIVKVADALMPLLEAVIDTVVEDATPVVFTENVADDFPLGILTVAGTVAIALALFSFTEMPPAGAGPFKDTVPVELVPPATVGGLRLSELSAGGVTVSVPDAPTKPALEVTVTAVVLLTPNV